MRCGPIRKLRKPCQHTLIVFNTYFLRKASFFHSLYWHDSRSGRWRDGTHRHDHEREDQQSAAEETVAMLTIGAVDRLGLRYTPTCFSWASPTRCPCCVSSQLLSCTRHCVSRLSHCVPVVTPLFMPLMSHKCLVQLEARLSCILVPRQMQAIGPDVESMNEQSF